MAGIYIHIPFCKKACSYCNFYFTTSTRFKKEYIAAVCQEMELRKDYLSGQTVDTIYFGGGTPSLLEVDDLNAIFEQLNALFKISPSAEITLEANPDDLDLAKLSLLKNAGINRLSIGVQSFQDDLLLFMNRAHNATEALSCIENAQEIGIENLSIDLIYGVPGLTESIWENELLKTEQLGVKHLSSYALTVEPNTRLAQDIKKRKTPKPKSEEAAKHFMLLQDFAGQNNWDHYEISNLAKKGFESNHNSSYWNGVTYLGIGTAAHSYNGTSRSWNVSNLKKYIDGISEGKCSFETEKLSQEDKFNEYVMTKLRTSDGVDLAHIEAHFPEYNEGFILQLSQTNKTRVIQKNEKIILTNEGRFFADGIASDFFIA